MKKLLCALVLGAIATTPAFAQDEGEDTNSRNGVRLEARVMWERLNDPQEEVGINYELGSGLSFGGEVGFDFAVSDKVVVGPYALYEASTVEQCDGDFCVSSGGYWAAGVHVGIITGNKGMVFIKGGYGQQTIDAVGPVEITPGTVINIDDSQSGGGYNLAGGYEHSFSRNFYGRVELGISESYGIYDLDFQRANIGVALGARF